VQFQFAWYQEKYETHHKVQIKDEAIIAAVELSQRYITNRFLPDKAIDLMDEAASKNTYGNQF
jgi:ATP-dependent Clp protease ATP-binding subunit ClpB